MRREPRRRDRSKSGDTFVAGLVAGWSFKDGPVPALGGAEAFSLDAGRLSATVIARWFAHRIRDTDVGILQLQPRPRLDQSSLQCSPVKRGRIVCRLFRIGLAAPAGIRRATGNVV